MVASTAVLVSWLIVGIHIDSHGSIEWLFGGFFMGLINKFEPQNISTVQLEREMINPFGKKDMILQKKRNQSTFYTMSM